MRKAEGEKFENVEIENEYKTHLCAYVKNLCAYVLDF